MDNSTNKFTRLPAEIISHVLEYIAKDPEAFQDNRHICVVDKFLLREIRRNSNLFKPKLTMAKRTEFEQNLTAIYRNDALQVDELRSELRKCFDQYFFPRYFTGKFKSRCKRCKATTVMLLSIFKSGEHSWSRRRIEWCSNNNMLVLYTKTVLYTHRFETGRDVTTFDLLTLDQAIETIVQTKIHNKKFVL